mgnify:CR=1 FL=1
MAGSAIAVPGKNPGEVYIPALGKSFRQVELREDDVIDSIETGTSTINAGTEYTVFRDIDNKNEQHSNMGSSKRIASGDEVAVFRIGVHLREAQGNTLPVFNDYRKVLGNAILDLKFNRRLITNGPLIKYPSGYGVGGFSDETGATAISIGVPSSAAAPTLFVPQQLTDTDDLNGKIQFKDAAWLTSYALPVLAGRVVVTVFLHGVMKAPLGK